MHLRYVRTYTSNISRPALRVARLNYMVGHEKEIGVIHVISLAGRFAGLADGGDRL